MDRGNGRELAISLWGKNILDEDHPGFVIGFGSVITGYSAQALSYGDPAAYGIDVKFSL